MAFEAKDGSKHTNHDSMKRADARMGQKPMGKSVAAMETPDGQEVEDPHAVVDQHGPADEVEIQHSEASHAVHSRHQDGYEHESQHGSREEAHQAGTCLGGACSCGSM
jgi:hypothetical protein